MFVHYVDHHGLHSSALLLPKAIQYGFKDQRLPPTRTLQALPLIAYGLTASKHLNRPQWPAQKSADREKHATHILQSHLEAAQHSWSSQPHILLPSPPPQVGACKVPTVDRVVLTFRKPSIVITWGAWTPRIHHEEKASAPRRSATLDSHRLGAYLHRRFRVPNSPAVQQIPWDSGAHTGAGR
jgi:hypothetical protein